VKALDDLDADNIVLFEPSSHTIYFRVAAF